MPEQTYSDKLAYSDKLDVELRFQEDDTRQSPGFLDGTLLVYEKTAGNRPELFARGALHWPEDGIVVNEQHDRKSPIVRAVPFMDGDAVKIKAALPNTTRGRDAATNVREGVLTGLSVEFRSESEGLRAGRREIRRARLVRAALVDSPEYTEATVEVRERNEADDDLDRFRRWL